MLDGTPLMDIKPYSPEFDAHPSSKAGWFDERREDRRVADERFHTARPRGDDSCWPAGDTALSPGSPEW